MDTVSARPDPSAAMRTDADFEVDGVRCAAWHYAPPGPGPHPCVVMAHGFTATRTDSLPTYAEAFAAAGMAVLLFDYRFFGDSGGEPRQQLHIGGQQTDWRAAVAHARALPGVDPTRTALWGSSFSGGHVIALAAEDASITAVVAQAPFVDGPATVRLLEPRNLLRLTAAAARDQLAAALGHSRVLVRATGAPGTYATLTAPEAEPGFAEILGPDSRWRNAYTAAVLLRLPLYRPGRALAKVAAPVLLCICDRDATVPPGAAQKAADRAVAAGRQVEVVHYDTGHFAVYVGDTNARAVADQTAFLARHLDL